MSNPISHQPMRSAFDQPPVEHHVHRDDEPLPGAKGAAPTFDYSPDTIEHANIPSSELGTTPRTQSTHGQHQTDSPLNFTSQERRDAPIVPTSSTQGGQPPIAPYDRIVLENALNATDDREEFERNPLRTPSESQKHEFHTQRDSDDSHRPTVPGTDAPQYDFPQEVGTTGNKEFGGDSGHGVKGHGSTIPGTSAPPSAFPHVGTTENREFGSNLDDSGVPTRSNNTHDTSGTTKKKDSFDIDGKPTREATTTHDTTTPEKVSLGDKVVGKVEKLAGKITGNPDLQVKGEQRAHPEKLN